MPKKEKEIKRRTERSGLEQTRRRRRRGKARSRRRGGRHGAFGRAPRKAACTVSQKSGMH